MLKKHLSNGHDGVPGTTGTPGRDIGVEKGGPRCKDPGNLLIHQIEKWFILTAGGLPAFPPSGAQQVCSAAAGIYCISKGGGSNIL